MRSSSIFGLLFAIDILLQMYKLIIHQKTKKMGQIAFYANAFFASVCGGIGILWYAKATNDPQNKPNLTIIILWFMLAILMTLTYKNILGYDRPGNDLSDNKTLNDSWIKITPSIVALIGNGYILWYLIRNRNYIFLKWDILILILGIAISITLFLLMKFKDFHLLLQGINTISYFPLILRIAQGKGKEPLGPWVIMSLGTEFAILTVLHNYKDFWDVMQPTRALICQALVIVFIVYKKKKAA